MNSTWKAYPDANGAAEACATQVESSLRAALASGRGVSFAISGGSTPKLLFEALAKRELPWSKIHIFWVDERAVPPSDPQNNYLLAEQTLIAPAHIPGQNIHRILSELPPQKAASRYEREIAEYFQLAPGDLPHFDLIHLGTGPDGHTASLFPGDPLVNNREGIAAAVVGAKEPRHRITLLPAVLLAARQVVFLVAGGDKAAAVEHILRGDYEPLDYPAQVVARHGQKVMWFLDQPAAKLLQ